VSKVKKWIVIGASIGAGIVTVGAPIVAGAIWYTNRPSSLGTHALTVVSGAAEVVYNLTIARP
jgi:hypothetical protein